MTEKAPHKSNRGRISDCGILGIINGKNPVVQLMTQPNKEPSLQVEEISDHNVTVQKLSQQALAAAPKAGDPSRITEDLLGDGVALD
jgi:hypothetical protein